MENSSSETGSTVTETNTPSSPPSKPAPKARKGKAPASLWPLTLLVIVLFALSGAASVYLWQELNKQNTIISKNDKSNEQLIKRLTQTNEQLTHRLNKLEENSSTQAQLLTTLDKLALFNTKELNRLHASNRVDWLLAEAEYLLRLGNQRLNIERDAKGAEAIFMAAGKVLAEIEDPSIYPVRESLAKEILSLQSVNKVDLNGIYLQIQAMIKALDGLNEASFLRADNEPEQAISTDVTSSDSYAEQLWQTIWNDLKTAVIIRRLDEPVAPLLAPEQSYFLKQNLQLMLEQAGLAVLNEDDRTYQQNLEKAEKWLEQYFVQKDAGIQAMRSSIANLKGFKISQSLPDISESLRLLKTRIEAMYRAHQLDRNTSINDEMKAQEDAIKQEQDAASAKEPQAL